MKQSIKDKKYYEVTASFKVDIYVEWRINPSMKEYNPGWVQIPHPCFSGGLVGIDNHSTCSQDSESTWICQIPQLS